MFIYVGGVPGVGKTTLVREAIKLAKERSIRMEEAGGVAILCQIAGVSTVEELRSLPEEVRRKLRPEMEVALRDMDARDPETIRLQDGHFVFFDVAGIEHGVRQVQPWDKERMLGVAVVLASPETVLHRRLRDVPHRSDRQCNLDFIIREQDLETKTAYSQASQIGIPICLVANEGTEVVRASEMLLGFCTHQALCRKMLS